MFNIDSAAGTNKKLESKKVKQLKRNAKALKPDDPALPAMVLDNAALADASS